jgi:ABC-type proline/glycine betaine transport system permease subunit
MAGVNQTLMLALSMVVIASMIAVGGWARWCCAALAVSIWGWPPSAAWDCDPRHYS